MPSQDFTIELVPAPLSNRARYRDIPEIDRLEAAGSPIHVALHRIEAAADEPRDYCALHRHPFAEVNILIGGPDELRYEITIGDETSIVSSPTTIWIPAGVPHSANLRGGRGDFVVLYVKEPQPDLDEVGSR